MIGAAGKGKVNRRHVSAFISGAVRENSTVLFPIKINKLIGPLKINVRMAWHVVLCLGNLC